MSNGFGRHNIVGSEVGRPRPIVYVRRERRQLRRRRRWPAALAVALAVGGLLTLLALLGA